MDCCLPGSSVHGILQARILEWVAMPFSRGHSWPRDWSWVSPIADSLPSEPPGKPWCQAYKDPIKQLWLSRRSYESEGLGAAFAEKALNTESLGWSPRCPIVPPIWSWHTHRSCHLAAVVGFLGAPAASWHEQWVSQSFQGKSKLAFLVGREILLLKVPNRTPEANPQLGWPLAWSKSHECFLSKVLGISTLASLDWTLEYPFQTPSPTPPILVMGTSDLVGVWTHQGPGAPFLGSPLSGHTTHMVRKLFPLLDDTCGPGTPILCSQGRIIQQADHQGCWNSKVGASESIKTISKDTDMW